MALKAGFDPGAHPPARQREVAARAARRPTTRASATSCSTTIRDIDRLEEIVAPGERQAVQMRIAPGVSPDTHPSISTGGPNTKFGFNLDAAPRRDRARHGLRQARARGPALPHRLADRRPRAVPSGDRGARRPRRLPRCSTSAAASASRTPSSTTRRAIEEYVAFKVDAVEQIAGPGKRILDEPGRALVANSTVTLYTVESVKRNVMTYVAVDGGMSDNLRPMLYGARYEAQVVGRPGGGTRCHLVGKHCESGDVLIHDADLADPRPGDVVVTPATGAYGFSMANTYNGQPRAPVVFVAGRRRAGRRAPRDLRRPHGRAMSDAAAVPHRPARPRHRRRRVRDAARRARRRDRRA